MESDSSGGLRQTLAAAEPIRSWWWVAIAKKVELAATGRIMKPLFLSCVLAVLPAFGQQASIALYTQFQHEPPPAVWGALQDEVNSIMARSDLRFVWRSLSAASGGEVWVELAVITFKGRCDVAGLRPHSPNPGPLGWTHLSDGAILPFADIDCDGIRSFIQKLLLTVPAENREEAYGRAVGRVFAHELYHIFADTTRHGCCGVGKSQYTVQELLSTVFHFEASESLALKRGKVHAALERALERAAISGGATGFSEEHF